MAWSISESPRLRHLAVLRVAGEAVSDRSVALASAHWKCRRRVSTIVCVMFFKTKRPEPEHISELSSVISNALPDVDDETRQIVVAVAGLLGCISYADRDFGGDEKKLVEDLLQSIHGVGQGGARAILSALEHQIVHVSTVEAPRYARALKQLGDRDLRLHVLGMLLEVAAVDHRISQDEVVVLRQITTSLGLQQSDYNDLQSKHRDKIATLNDR